MIGGLTQEQRLTISAAAVVYCESFTGVDANAYLRCWNVFVFLARLSQNIDDDLCDCHGFAHAGSFRIIFSVVRFRNQSVQTLIVEVHTFRFRLVEDAVNGPVMQVQEAKCAFVARLAFSLGNVEDILQVRYVSIEMHTIHAVRRIGRNILERHVAFVFLDIDTPYLFNLAVNVFCCSIVVPCVCHDLSPR